MRGSKSKLISSLFRSSTKSFFSYDSKSATTTTAAAKKLTLEQLFPIIDSSSDTKNTSSSTSEAVDKQPKKSSRVLSKSLSRSRKPPPITARENSGIRSPSESQSCSSSDGSEKALLNAISSILGGSNDTVSESCSLPASEAPDDQNSVEKVLDIPWFSNTSQISVSQRRKELSRERKQKWVFKTTQNRRFDRLVTMCGDKLGAKTTLEVFGRLGRETGVKEYNALIGLCIEKARTSQEEEVSLDHVHKAFQLLKAMKEQGFQLGEQAYRPVLIYLIDMEMVEEFQFFSSTMKDENTATLSRLGYYEMLLWARVDNKDKIQELFNGIGVDSDGGSVRFDLAESYLLALCETDRMEEVLQLLDIIDVTKVSSLDYLSSIFKSLGRRSMENSAEKFILALKNSDAEAGAENLSLFICNYITSMPNLATEDAILNFKRLHEKLDVTPTSRSYAMLVAYFCDLLKVHAALDVVEQMSQLGFSLSVETFQHIVRAVEESYELDLVHPVYSMMHNHNLKPGCETFRSMINMCVRMKDFEGAYNMLTGLTEMDIMPTANMYNAIMAGYFREKNIHSALMVLNQMKKADVKPDSQTFSYLIGNSECEEDIVKYYEEMQSAGIQATKHVYMSLINAYVNLGQFQKAKQVVLDQGVPVKFLGEVKSVLVQALASHGQMSEALEIYEGIKQDKSVLDPKAAISLIEHVQCEGELDRLLQLLGELTDPDMWFDGCGRVILYCVRYKHLSSAVDLLKKLKDKDEMSMDVVIVQVFSQIWEAEPPALDIGLDLLRAIKEEVGLRPSRTILDFLLSACVTAKDLHSAWLIWEEYSKAGMLCNVLTFLRMYQVLLASGDYKAAKKMLKKIPKDDTHVRRLIQECQATFLNSVPVKKKKEIKCSLTSVIY